MAWARFDDQFYDHPKVLSLDPALALQCVGLQLLATCWCSKQLSDGVLPASLPSRLGANRKIVAELVRVGMWEDGGTEYIIHDYLDYNPSREQVEADREAAKERMNRARVFRGSSGEHRAKFGLGSDNPVPSPPDVLTEHKKSARGAPVDNSRTGRRKAEPQQIASVFRELASMGAIKEDEA
jgi:hypothetical protein